MKRQPLNNAYSLLLDLASTLAIPRISKYIHKLMWPALSNEDLSEFNELAAKISRLLSFECKHERWPFQGGSEKVVTVLKAIATMQNSGSNWKELSICYTKEYYLELSFQRFFAWAVYQHAGEIDGDVTHFHYRNAYANARSVLAMPLLVDLSRQNVVNVGQGNFGYKPSRILDWIYPHLSHYLSAFYYPWIPNVNVGAAGSEAALGRAIKRSRHVSLELFRLLTEGSALRIGLGGDEHLEATIASLFQTSAISPFVRVAITNTNFIDLFKVVRDYHEQPEEFEAYILDDRIINETVSQYLDVDREYKDGSIHEKLIQTCQHNLNVTLHRELDEPDCSDDFFRFDESEFRKFLKWRYFEERLRLAVDRLLLERRFLDPPLARSRFSLKFENLGLFALEVPEIQFNLYLEDFNRSGTSPEEEPTPRIESCREWMAAARQLYQADKNAMWSQGSFPFHALFETYLMDGDPERASSPFWMGLLLSHLVPPVDPNDKKAKRGRGIFLEQANNRMKEWANLKPFAPLAAILDKKKKETLNSHYGEDCELWLWLSKKLDQLCEQQLKACWEDVTFKQIVEGVLKQTPQPWIDPKNETECAIRQVLSEQLSEETELSKEQELLLQKLVKQQKEALEQEDRGRRFFSYASFFGINTTIFRALIDQNYGRNFITIRLIATERTSANTALPLENQDHADFVGSYVVWQRGDDGGLKVESPDGSYVPRYDAWREEETIEVDSQNKRRANSLAELHNLKPLIKNLGISLLNQERIKEQERLNAVIRKETTRSTIAGIIGRNLSHNIGSHVLASSGLLEGVHLTEIQKLHNFLQQRMDFLAQVITYTPSWGEPMFFFKDLLGEFFNQYLLLANLIKDQGYPNITFRITIDDRDKKSEQEFIFERRCFCGKCERQLEGEVKTCNCINPPSDQPLIKGSWQLSNDGPNAPPLPEKLVAVPGGAIGAHAFYVILENILRNSAKYGNQQQQKEGLQVHIGLNEAEDHFRVKIWDNTGQRDGHKPDDPKNCECRICVVQRRLADELIDPDTGVITEKSRGIHEMKECATILISPHLEELGQPLNGERVALWASAEKYDNQQYLQYNLVLQKPRLVGIVDTAGEVSDDAKNAGVFHYTRIENLARYPHQLGLIYLRPESRDEIFKYLEAHHYLLPYRLLLVDKTGGAHRQLKLHPRRVQWCDIATPTDSGSAVWEEFVIELWGNWLRRFRKQSPGKWQMMVGFEREEKHAAFKRWQLALEKFESNVVEVYLTRANKGGCEKVEWPKDTDLFKLAQRIEHFESSWIVLDNHGSGFSYLRGVGRVPFGDKSKLRAYHSFGSADSIKLFQTMESPPSSDFGFKLFILGLIESSLMNVVLVDERVADAVYDNEHGFKKGLMLPLRSANCFPIFSLWTEQEGKPKPERKFVSETIGQRSERFKVAYRESINEREGIWLSEKEPHIFIHVPGGEDEVQELDRSEIDTIVIHQGVIDVLDQNNLWQGDHHLEILHQLSPSVIITSGRGRTIRHINKREIPFVEFSIIKDNTYAGLSKYHLVRSLLSVAGESRSVENHERSTSAYSDN